MLVSLLRPTTRPLHHPLLALLGFVIGWRFLTPSFYQSPTWSEWQDSLPVGVSLVTSRVQWIPPALLMSLCLPSSGLKRGDLFLKRGEWNVPVQRDVFFPFPGVSWPILFVVFLFLSYTLGPLVWILDMQPDLARADDLFVHLPGILAGSALNALFEEYIFRMLLLAYLIPAVGTKQAIGMTGILFGFEHCETAGLIGVVLSSITGWIFAKSMIETGGCRWAMVQHILGDIPIYAIVAMKRL